jgi:replicative DNA helicase
MEQQLLRKLLEFDFYNSHKHVTDALFPVELRPLYYTIEKAHDAYKTDIDPAWLKKLHSEYNPGLTTAQRGGIAVLLDDISHDAPVPDAMASDIINSMYRRQTATDIAHAALRVVDGNVDNFNELLDLAANLEDTQVVNEAYEEVEFDLDNLLTKTSHENLHNFRLETLAEKVPGVGPGNFVIVFARPESGKTTYSCYEAAGFLKQRLKVCYFANEEPAVRVYIRLLCSYLNMTADEIRAEPNRAQDDFGEAAGRLRMIDCVGMDIREVDSWCKRNTPDILVLDQLDKFGISGNYSRSDERLGELYQAGREIAKRNNCVSWAVSQASADGADRAGLTFSMMAGSKTAKAAEADLIIGIGHNSQLHAEDYIRQFNVDKNKINGWHGAVTCTMDPQRAMFGV